MEWNGTKTVGLWTVLDSCIETPKGERKWLCRCACGTERYVSERSLRYGGSRSCGCAGKKKRLESISYRLEGKTFGDLTVLRKSEHRKPDSRRGIWWTCRCSCGKECDVLASLLVSGKKTHCGCKTVNYRDITGKRFHSLTVLYRSPERNEKGERLWRCRCDCGNEIDATYKELAYSNTRSCGCKKKEHNERIQGFLTHIDGTSIDRIRSKRLPADNTTGVRGVYFHRGKWVAKIVFQHQQYHLGRFNTKQEAAEARLAAEKMLFDGAVRHYERWKTKAEADPFWAEQNPIRILVDYKENSPKVTFLPNLTEHK